MKIAHQLARAACMVGALFFLTACSTSNTLQTATPDVTNAPASGFADIAPGSEEDFILNVGRRTYFAEGSATLDSTARFTLDKQIEWLKKYPHWLVKLQGFSDDPGSEAAQVDISARRAEAVMNYLAAGGIDRNRMWAKGYGKERIVRDCPQKACKVANRRVISNLREEKDGAA